jgi:hypothetical protein
MNYNRLLSISVPLGILLSGCSPYTKPATKSGSRSATTVKLYYAPMPNYVKYNHLEPHQKTVAKNVKPLPCNKTKKSFIIVALVQNADNTGSITYMTVDDDGKPGKPYSKANPSSENANSTLFSPLMFDDSFKVEPTTSGSGCREVKISGTVTGTDNKPKTDSWVSNSDNRINDDDVTWDH